MINLYKYLKVLRENAEDMDSTPPVPDDDDKEGVPPPPGEPVALGGDDSGDDPNADALSGDGADPMDGVGGDAVSADSKPDRIFAHPDELAELLKTNPTLFHRIQDLIEKDPATLHLLHDAGKKGSEEV